MLGRRAERNGIQFRITEFHSFGDSAIRCSTASKLRNLRRNDVMALRTKYVCDVENLRSIPSTGNNCLANMPRPGQASSIVIPPNKGTKTGQSNDSKK